MPTTDPITPGTPKPAPAPYDPKNPLADEEAQLPSAKLSENYQKQVSESYTKHLANSLRADHKDIPPDASDADIFKNVHQAELPQATPEQFWNALGKVYGYKWQPPAEPNWLVQGAHMVADFPASILQDVTALPKGAVELGQGVGKIAAGEMQGAKNAAFTGMSSGPSDQLQEGLDLVDKSKAHFARAGAFALASLAAEATGGLGVPMLAELGITGESAVGKLLTNSVKGAIGGASFMGPYAAAREAAKTGATPGEAWTAFVEGSKGGLMFGAGVGAGATIMAPAARKAWGAGKAMTEALTMPAAKRAALKFSDAFMPEWVPPDVHAGDAAKSMIENFFGKDVAESKVGEKAMREIESRIITHRAVGVRLEGSASPAEIKAKLFGANTPRFGVDPKVEVPPPAEREPFSDVLRKKEPPVLDNQTPTLPNTQPQAMNKEGIPLWNVMIKEQEGVVGSYNVAAHNAADAATAATSLAKHVNGELVGQITPQGELRSATDRRVNSLPVPEGSPERRVADRRADSQRLVVIQAEAEAHLHELKTLKGNQVRKFFKKLYPKVEKYPYSDTEELRGWLERELNSKLQGASQAREGAVANDLAAESKVIKSEEVTPVVEKKGKKNTVTISNAGPEWVGEPTGGPTPQRTRFFGRGANGSVQVTFPTREHAELASLRSNSRKLMMGDATLAQQQKFANQIKHLGIFFGMDRQELMVLADKYAGNIKEFVKGHPSYDESGATLSAPDILEKRMNPEDLKRLAQEKVEKGKISDEPPETFMGKTDKVKTQSSTKLSYIETVNEILSKSRAALAEIYSESISNAPKMGRWKLVNLHGKISEGLTKSILETKEYHGLLQALQSEFDFFHQKLSSRNPDYKNTNFAGFTTYDFLGLHVGDKVPKWKGTVLVSPWENLRLVKERIAKGMVDNTPEAKLDDLARQLTATIIHEVSHTVAKGEEAVAAELTTNLGHFIDDFPALKYLVKKELEKPEVMKMIEGHTTALDLDREARYEAKKVGRGGGGLVSPRDNPENPSSLEPETPKPPILSPKDAGVDITDFFPAQELGLEELDY